jgi:glycosyltransferase involved in cell wall biosynthesis
VAQIEEKTNLVILGDGDLRPELVRQVEALGLEGLVELPGNVEQDQVARYFAAADLFSFASANETQGLVVLEAMAAGTPTVVVNEGGIKDFVRDGENGITTDNNPQALAQAMDRVLRTPDLERLRSKARETAWSFSVESQTRRISEVYSRAMRKQRSAVDSRAQGDRKDAPLAEFAF